MNKGNVIFEKSRWENWSGRYHVETQAVDVGYYSDTKWYLDRAYKKKSSAIARAEKLLHRDDVGSVRVILKRA